jgi:chromosome partitioning protein
MAIVVSFANNKGGVGKTTTTLVMAQAFARMKKKVLVIDLDSQSNLTLLLGDVQPTARELTILDALTRPDVLPIEKVDDNIDLIPSDLNLATFDTTTASNPDHLFLLKEVIKKVSDDYDFILIDCPPALGNIIYNAFIASDFVTFVTTPDELSYQGLKMIHKVYDHVKSKHYLNPDIQVAGTIITKCERNRNTDLFLGLLRDDLKLRVIEPVISKATKIAQTTSSRRSIFDADPNGKATQQYVEVAKSLALRLLTESNHEVKQ